MCELKKISNNEYSYKGLVVARYENSSGATRWCIEKSGIELRADITTRRSAIDYIYQHPEIQA